MIVFFIVIIVDDLFLENGMVFIFFDDEGVVIFKKEVVLNGKFIILFYNLKMVNKVGVKIIGNGIKFLYLLFISIYLINFYIEKGDKFLDEIIKDIDEGLMVISFVGFYLGVNLVIGDFFLVVKGFYIKEGKKVFLVE